MTSSFGVVTFALLNVVPAVKMVAIDRSTGTRLPCPQGCSCIFVEGRLSADCSDVGFTELPSKMPPGIMVLMLDGNNFSKLDKLNFPPELHGSGLRQLLLRNCRLNAFNAEDTWVLPNLIRLSMANNILKKIPFAVRKHVRYSPFHTMTNLQTLDLSGNEISQLEAYNFEGAVQLSELILSKNRIATIDQDAFQGLPSLRKILLDRNWLTTIEADSFMDLQNLKVLNLMENRWSCDCNMRSFVQWQQGKYLTEPPLCLGPARNEGKRWDQLKVDEFACSPRVSPWTSRREKPAIGSNTSFECLVQGDPEPVVEWKFYNYENETTVISGPRMTENKRMVFSNVYHRQDELTWIHSLILLAIRAEDLGLYQCTASNAAGISSIEFHLEPRDPARNAGGILKSVSHSQISEYNDVLLVTIVVVILIISVVVISVLAVCYRWPSVKGQKKSLPSDGSKAQSENGYATGICKAPPLVTENEYDTDYGDSQNSRLLNDHEKNKLVKWNLIEEDGFYTTEGPYARLSITSARETARQSMNNANSPVYSECVPLAVDEWDENGLLRETAL